MITVDGFNIQSKYFLWIPKDDSLAYFQVYKYPCMNRTTIRKQIEATRISQYHVFVLPKLVSPRFLKQHTGIASRCAERSFNRKLYLAYRK